MLSEKAEMQGPGKLKMRSAQGVFCSHVAVAVQVSQKRPGLLSNRPLKEQITAELFRYQFVDFVEYIF